MTKTLKTIIATLAAAAVAATLLLLTTTSSDAGTPRLTVKALKSAWVPSLCGQRSGHLVDGKMPGIKPSNGEVRLRTGKVVFGHFAKNGPREAAAAFTCDQGGVPWPDYVVFYKPGARGPVYDGKVDLGRLHRFEYGSVRTLRIADHRATVTWRSGQADECDACGTADASAGLRPVAGTKVKVVHQSLYTGRTFAKRFITAINKGRRNWAYHHSTGGTADELRDWYVSGGPITVGSCVSSPEYAAARRCKLTDAKGHHAWVTVQRTGWRAWKAVVATGVN